MVNISKKTLSVPLDALKKKKRIGLYEDLELIKLMKYYGFERKEQLLEFLKSEHIQY